MCIYIYVYTHTYIYIIVYIYKYIERESDIGATAKLAVSYYSTRLGFQHWCLPFRPLPYLTWPIACRNSTGLNPCKQYLHFSICACHPCAGAMLVFSVSIQC